MNAHIFLFGIRLVLKSKKKNPLLILENEFMNEVRLSHSYFH